MQDNATDETIAAELRRLVENADRRATFGTPAAGLSRVAGHDDRPDYFYLELTNGQRFKVEVTETYDRWPS